ncbi:UbiA family prenyltransferase [Streptomyces sp. NPDC052225]|uniref:UbiA family prenyltransferase n=1 Tax=Streptomyces sp. NPDC052225 TaxID=3154949 RepID=UPI003443F7B2
MSIATTTRTEAPTETPDETTAAKQNGPFRILALCAQESRYAVQLIFLLRFTVAAAALVPGAAVWLCCVAFTYLYNGISDIGEDRVNGSVRPIARGALPVPTARRVCLLLVALAVTGGALLGPTTCVLTLCMLALGYAYSAPAFALKRTTPGTMVAVFGSGLLTYLAGTADGPGRLTPELIVFAVALTLWMTLVGAVAKDFSDTEGDARAGRRNWTLQWGSRRTAVLVTLSSLAIGGSLAAAAVLLSAPGLAAPAATVLCGALALSVAALTTRPGASRTRRRVPYRVFMVTQYTAHLVTFAQPIS